MLLLRLPCGCVVNFMELTYPSANLQYLACPWCHAVFDSVDIHDWIQCQNRVSIDRLVSLICRHGELFEVVDMCPCGKPIVRRFASGKREPEHVTTNEYTVMWN